MAWRRLTILASCSILVLSACGGGSDELRWDGDDVDVDDVREQARELGMLAACDDGTFDSATTLSDVCGGRDQVVGWLHPFAECVDGSYVVLAGADDPSCESAEGFRRAVDEPTPGPDDVAVCNDGLFDDEDDLGENCKRQGGIDRFLAEYAECENGRVILMTAEGIGCEDGIARLLPDDYEPTPGPDDVAVCNDGLFDNEDDLGENCKKQGGVDRFLAEYAECENGRVILMTAEGIGCEDGIAQLLPDYEPDAQPAADDVAVCNDGLFDNEDDLGENCKKQGGIDRFLAEYAECENGRVILMTAEGIGCEDGIARLLPDDYEPTPGPDDVAVCNDELFDNEDDLGENCKKQGGIDRFLATYAECGDGEVVRMTADAKCEGGITLLPDDYVPPPTTTTSPPTPSDLLLGAVAKNSWGDVLNRYTEERSLYIVVRSDESLTDGLTKDNSRYAVADVLERVQDSGGISAVDEVVVVIRHPLVNQYGEVSEENVILATYPSQTVQRIVFDNIDQRDILSLSDISLLYVHPAFQY